MFVDFGGHGWKRIHGNGTRVYATRRHSFYSSAPLDRRHWQCLCVHPWIRIQRTWSVWNGPRTFSWMYWRNYARYTGFESHGQLGNQRKIRGWMASHSQCHSRFAQRNQWQESITDLQIYGSQHDSGNRWGAFGSWAQCWFSLWIC